MSTPAEAAALANSGYNYYPAAMIRLCAVSYLDIGSIPAAVENLKLGWKVVWGPAQLLSILDEAYSLAFVAYRSETQEYTVVIRGTNMDSLEDWATEDFEIDSTVPFSQLVPNAPAGAVISQGTCNGINDLLSLTDPKTGASMVSFLQNAQPRFLYVTGHSLGGTLTPPMFAYLNYVLYGGGYVTNMALWSFAGLTPGNSGFNDYFNSLFNPQFPFRLYNTFDIAPFCWWSKQGLEGIYWPQISYGEPESGVFDVLFDLAAGQDYEQPSHGGTPLPGALRREDGWFPWVDEAMYQHHPATYQTLVDKMYPQPLEAEACAETSSAAG